LLDGGWQSSKAFVPVDLPARPAADALCNLVPEIATAIPACGRLKLREGLGESGQSDRSQVAPMKIVLDHEQHGIIRLKLDDDRRNRVPAEQPGGPPPLMPADDLAVGPHTNRLTLAIPIHVIDERRKLPSGKVVEECPLVGMIMQFDQPYHDDAGFGTIGVAFHRQTCCHRGLNLTRGHRYLHFRC
jgi:hypothetical protein